MKCDICDMAAVINDLCQGCYDDLAKGGDDALRAAEMFQLRIAELKSESNKLHDALERQGELIAALRNEVATWKNGFAAANEALRLAAQRIAELEAAQHDGRTYSEGCKP